MTEPKAVFTTFRRNSPVHACVEQFGVPTILCETGKWPKTPPQDMVPAEEPFTCRDCARLMRSWTVQQ